MATPKFILWGAKGHALVLAEIVQEQGGKVIALFDSSAATNAVLSGVKIHSGLAAYDAWLLKQENVQSISAIAAIGGARGRDRREFLEVFRKSGFKTPTLIHSSAVVSRSAHIGENSHILAGAVIAPMVELGEACIVNTNASVDHECLLAAGVHVAPGATLCGCVCVGENTLIGAGSVVLPRIRIGSNVVIGAGSVVTRDIPDSVMAFGNPAKIIKAL
jgi:sugar O-acyltransferase (sialic acid O-acetyltransferase NeuD family)